MKSTSFCTALVLLVGLSHASLSAGFTTTINDPPTPIGDNAIILANTQLNVFAGGSVGFHLTAGEGLGSANVEINIYNGVVGDELFVGSAATVNIAGGTVGNSFSAPEGSKVNISGGTIGNRFGANGTVNITGGSIGDTFSPGPAATINISGGTFGTNFVTSSVSNLGPTINFSGASTGSFTANSFSKINISGGAFREYFSIFADSSASISGGTFTNNFHAFERSSVNFIGDQFAISGIPIVGAQPGQKYTLTDRDATLSGVLANGTPFSFYLSTVFPPSDAGLYFSRTATITLTLVPEPSTLVTLLSAIAALSTYRRRPISQKRI